MAETAKRYNSILKIIDDRLVPDEGAKKARGEVFTPLNLVREMLFGIRKGSKKTDETEIWGINKDGNFFDEDEDNRVGGIPLPIWRDPKTKWLDPANGIGNFPVVAFYILDYQLGEHGPKEFRGGDNKIKRRRHIVKNMLYMIELNKGNVNTSRKIFEKIVPGVSPNILCANTLEMTDERLKKEFGINKFHVVMGNPPYQPNQLWEKFIIKGISYLEEDGFIGFVVPTSWTSPTSDSWKKLRELDIQVINNASYLEKQYFPKVSSTFSYFIVNNNKPRGKTIVIYDINTYFSLKLEDVVFLPKVITKDTISINKKVLINKDPGRFIRKDMGADHTKVNSVYRYPFITFIKTSGEPDIKYHNIQDPKQDKKKVLLFRSGYPNPYYDHGKYGVGDNIHALELKNKTEEEDKKEGENIVKLFKSKLYQYIFHINKHSAYNLGGLMDMLFRDVSKFDGFSDDDINSYFKLTPDELKTIDKYPPPKRRISKTVKSNQGGGSRKPHRFTRRKSRS
jgi:hypothetical protein